MEYRIGQGYDVHVLREGLPMWLAGVKVESSVGFVAHSDGDVVVHALCDAILGALALGDIGHLFPDTDDKWKGASGKVLLSIVMDKVRGLGWGIGNVDVTIALQAPKIAPYISSMRESLADILGVNVDCISVKATTTERLGFVGRGEGCEVWASVLLVR